MAELKMLATTDDRRPAQIDATEQLLLRLDLLRPADKLLMEMRIRHGVSFAKLAALTGTTPKTVSRRIRQLYGRLCRSDYITILRHDELFNAQEQSIAYDHFLLGLGYRPIARRYNLSNWQARCVLERMRNVLTAIHHQPRRRNHRPAV